MGSRRTVPATARAVSGRSEVHGRARQSRSPADRVTQTVTNIDVSLFPAASTIRQLGTIVFELIPN